VRAAVVIPAYNEARTIERVVRAVLSFGTPIVVDDGSTDGTGATANRAGAIVVGHSSNRGYEAALESGFKYAAAEGFDVAVTFDADAQHDPEILPRFLDPIRDGRADVVVGVRRRPPRLAERLFGLYARLRFGVDDVLCGLKAYRMDVYRRHGRFDGLRSVGTELLLASMSRGARIETVEVPIFDRQDRPRFGSQVGANARILGALVRVVLADAFGWKQS
jgi:glycosyltransferase involved in cell wall biosynthesis